jgi:hypothetical protein
MQCLTVCQPYAAALIHGPKRVENRRWYMKHRGLLAIHAGKSLDWLDTLSDEELATWPDYKRSSLVFGAIIGVVTVFDCERLGAADSPDPWRQGPWCILVREPIALPKPIAWRGQQGLFEVPDEVIAAQLPNLVDPLTDPRAIWKRPQTAKVKP